MAVRLTRQEQPRPAASMAVVGLPAQSPLAVPFVAVGPAQPHRAAMTQWEAAVVMGPPDLVYRRPG
ncbi:MAG: hypothetical protein AB7R89_18940 [Dehalococcoidia bacterium]